MIQDASKANPGAASDASTTAGGNQITIVGPSDQATTNLLWKVLVFALAAISLMSLVGLVVLIALGKTPDLVLTAFTASVTGLVGLFVPAPGNPS